MAPATLSLESARESLIRQEDTIVFSLIERTQYPFNAPAYDAIPCLGGSLAEVLVKETEVLHAKVKYHHHLTVSQTAGEPSLSLFLSLCVSLARKHAL